jgi:hypothetical protein
MSTIRRRLTDIEERQAVLDYRKCQRLIEGRSQDELHFFSVYGYFPDSLAGKLPERQEFTVGGIRTVITAERVCPSNG